MFSKRHMACLRCSWGCVVTIVLLLMASVVQGEPPTSLPTTASAPVAPALMDCDALRVRLDESQRRASLRGAELDARLAEVAKAFEALEGANGGAQPGKINEQKEKLASERTALQDERKHLDAAATAWQAAVDACENTANLKHDLGQLSEALERGDIKFVEADVLALQAELSPLAQSLAASGEAETVRSERLAAIAGKLGEAEPSPVIQAEQSALEAEIAGIRHKRAEIHAKRTLLEARLAAAREHVGDQGGSPPATTSPAASAGDEAAASLKQRISELLAADARDRLESAREELKVVEAAIAEATSREEDVGAYENDRVYWSRVTEYEKRRLQQAELHARAAQQKEAVGQLRRRITEAEQGLEELRSTRSEMTQERREERAVHYRELAAAQLEEAAVLEEKARADAKEIDPVQDLLPGIDAVETALKERFQGLTSVDEAERFEPHYRRMGRQLEKERQLLDLVVTTMTVVAYAKTHQATMMRELADVYQQCADTLVPPVPSFWERNRSIFNSIWVVVSAFVVTYLVRFVIWLLQYLLTRFNRTCSGVNFSVKRVGTLLGFVGSIVKVFVWVFAIVAILNEFGIDYATSTGAIGLIGLIMAGMFQQIVIDFVKGLDIIASRHYNVGDFIEVDGKCGHVVDFNVKYTRIRTVSGQECNVPNSRCVPSRRFPDGYVDNYVDLAFASGADVDRAVEVLKGVCADLNRRIEPIKEVPELASRFREGGGRVTARYLVRVLPGCGWVVTDHVIPAFKAAVAELGVELSGEPTTFFINRIEVFRQLFSRSLTEEEIVRHAKQDEVPLPAKDPV